MAKATPMMDQYFKIKKAHPDSIIFFRLGDFYEMFFEDAEEASKILEIVLTGRPYGNNKKAPMCGVPYHSCSPYIEKLINAGKKIAICEQMEDPKFAKGLVERKVIRIITPGTYIDDKEIKSFQNNYIMSLIYTTFGFSVAYTDISTKEWNIGTISEDDFLDFFLKLSPKEMVADEEFVRSLDGNKKVFKQLKFAIEDNGICISAHDFKNTSSKISDHTKILNQSENIAFNTLVQYVAYTQNTDNVFTGEIKRIDESEYLKLNFDTVKNLELLRSNSSGIKKNSLFGILDHTQTSMGARTLRKWIEKPLKNITAINNRLDIIETLISDPFLISALSETIREIYDIERISGKVTFGTASVADFVNLRKSLEYLPKLNEIINNSGSEILIQNFGNSDDLSDVYKLLFDTLSENPSSLLRDGEIIKEGYSAELDDLRETEKHSSDIIQKIEEREREKTRIKNLKIGYNKVFGYYIEISHAAGKNKEIPENYIRKQTLSTAERYINQELKAIEEKILTAREKSVQLQSVIYNELKDKIKESVFRIQQTSNRIGRLDSIISLSCCATENNYVRPEITNDGVLRIMEGRHPVIEKRSSSMFVPNDIKLDNDKNFMIITGPNMGGKSTYMRQNALIIIMAHMGSFVPAGSAKIPLTDAVFTRVGASDDLSGGQSTFMVEMKEVSYILSHATKDSVVLLDEVGRGTGTYDGMSIAWAIISYICDHIHCKTLFATHYHEITNIEEEKPSVVNYSVAVQEKNGEINFLRKVMEGKTDKSYGIHVAKLADLPMEVIRAADEKLIRLEQNFSVSQNSDENVKPIIKYVQNPTVEYIKNLDIDSLSPIECLLYLKKLKDGLK